MVNLFKDLLSHGRVILTHFIQLQKLYSYLIRNKYGILHMIHEQPFLQVGLPCHDSVGFLMVYILYHMCILNQVSLFLLRHKHKLFHPGSEMSNVQRHKRLILIIQLAIFLLN